MDFNEWYDSQPLVLLDRKSEHRLTWEAAIATHQERIAELTDLLEEQKGTIKALNWSLGGEDSTSTENLIDAHEVDYADEGLIALCRKLTQENVRLEDVVLCQKKAWSADFDELERLRDQASSIESSPITEEVEDILRSEISRLKGALAKCKETLVSSISDLQEPNFATLAAWRIKEALAAIKEEGL